MHTYQEKVSENKGQPASREQVQMPHGGKSVRELEDQRSEAIAQRKLQELAKNSTQVKQMRAFQKMANERAPATPVIMHSGLIAQTAPGEEPVEQDVMQDKAVSAQRARQREFALIPVQHVKKFNSTGSNKAVFQLKDYGDKFKDEKAEILKKLRELQIAGISSREGDDFTWHHKFPHSKFKDSDLSKLKDARNYLTLGPNPATRIKGDDPGNEGVDLNYLPTSKEQPEPLSPRISRKLKVEHEKFGFEDLLEKGISRNSDLQDEGTARTDISLEEVSREWNQWFIPSDLIIGLDIEKDLKELFKSEELQEVSNTGAKTSGKPLDPYKVVSDKIRGVLMSLQHDYIVFERPEPPGKKFTEKKYTGVPVTNLTPPNLGLLHPVLDKLLQKRSHWLRRGSMGGALDKERQRIALLDQKKFSEENILKIREKFNRKDIVDLIEKASISPSAFSKVVNLFEDHGLGKELTDLTSEHPITRPEDLDKLLDETTLETLEQSLLKQIEEMIKDEDDFQLLSWCARYLPEEEEESAQPGEAIESLKAFIAAYNTKKEEGPEQQQGGEEEEDAPEEPKLGRKDRRKDRAKKKKQDKNERALAKKEQAKLKRNKKNQDEESDQDEEEVQKEFIPGLDALLKEHPEAEDFFGRTRDNFDEDTWKKLSALLLVKKAIPLPEEIVSYLNDEEEGEEDGSYDPHNITHWAPRQSSKVKPEYDITKYKTFFTKEDTDFTEKTEDQQELGEFDLTQDYSKHGLNPDIIGVLALKAHMLDTLRNNPKKLLAKKETRQQLAKSILDHIKKELAKRKDMWARRIEENGNKLNENYLLAKIKDLLFEIKPQPKELEEDFLKRAQDEVSLSLVSHLEASEQESFELVTGKAKAQPSKARSELIAYLDDTLPRDIIEEHDVLSNETEIRDHLVTYIDPATGTFNNKLWQDVKAQIMVRVDKGKIRLFETIEKDVISDPKKYLEKDKLKSKKEDSPGGKEVGKDKELEPQMNAEELDDLVEQQDNQGGGDCLFYALSKSDDRDTCMALRARIAAANNNISKLELRSLLNDTPGLTRFAYRVPDHDDGEFNTDEVYRKVISTQGTWGGRTEIATYSRLDEGHRVAVVELERGVVESVTIYQNGAGRVVRFPSQIQLQEALTGKEIIIHKGGNHWVSGTLKG